MFNRDNYSKGVCFDLVHNDFPYVTVGTSSELRIVRRCWELKDELTLPCGNNSDFFPLCIREDAEAGIISVFDGKTKDPEKLLLRLSLEKNPGHCSKAELLELCKNIKAVVYRPLMGGGDHIIMAVGKVTADLSRDTILKSLPHWDIPQIPGFKCPLGLEAKASCDEHGVMTRKNCRRFNV